MHEDIVRKMAKNIDLSFIHINDKIHPKKHYLYLNMIYRDTVHWPSLLWKKLTLKYSFCTSDVLLKNTSFAAESNILVLAWGCLLTPDVQGIPFPFFFQFQGSPIPSYPFQPPTLSFRFPVLCPHCKPQSCQKRAQNMAEFDSYWIVLDVQLGPLLASLIVRSSSSRCLNKPTTMSADTHGWVLAPKNTEWCQIIKRPKCPGYIVHSQKWLYILL